MVSGQRLKSTHHSPLTTHLRTTFSLHPPGTAATIVRAPRPGAPAPGRHTRRTHMRHTRMLLAVVVLLAGTTARADEFFNGKNTDGWEGLSEFWKVEDGALIGSSDKNIPFNTFLCSKKKYSDFELSFHVRLK